MSVGHAKGLTEIICIGLLSVLFAVDHSASQEKILLDLRGVADKPRSEIEKILGIPFNTVEDVFRSTRGHTYPAIRATYMNGAIEVTYLEGRARYFTLWVQKLGGKYLDYSYPKDVGTHLGELGLDRDATADLSNQTVTRWRDFPGIYEINIFPTAERKIWYAHVSTSRMYQ